MNTFVMVAVPPHQNSEATGAPGCRARTSPKTFDPLNLMRVDAQSWRRATNGVHTCLQPCDVIRPWPRPRHRDLAAVVIKRIRRPRG
jgi:hypothetical protein